VCSGRPSNGVRREPRLGTAEGQDAPEISLWVLYPSRRLLSARVSAFLEHLKSVFPSEAPQDLAAFVDP